MTNKLPRFYPGRGLSDGNITAGLAVAVLVTALWSAGLRHICPGPATPIVVTQILYKHQTPGSGEVDTWSAGPASPLPYSLLMTSLVSGVSLGRAWCQTEQWRSLQHRWHSQRLNWPRSALIKTQSTQFCWGPMCGEDGSRDARGCVLMDCGDESLVPPVQPSSHRRNINLDQPPPSQHFPPSHQLNIITNTRHTRSHTAWQRIY